MTESSIGVPAHSSNGDPDWIRTNNLPLRRGLLYPVEHEATNLYLIGSAKNVMLFSVNLILVGLVR